MSLDLILASASMMIALVLYSLGVFGEKFSGTIKGKHLIFFVSDFIKLNKSYNFKSRFCLLTN